VSGSQSAPEKEGGGRITRGHAKSGRFCTKQLSRVVPIKFRVEDRGREKRNPPVLGLFILFAGGRNIRETKFSTGRRLPGVGNPSKNF